MLIRRVECDSGLICDNFVNIYGGAFSELDKARTEDIYERLGKLGWVIVMARCPGRDADRFTCPDCHKKLKLFEEAGL